MAGTAFLLDMREPKFLNQLIGLFLFFATAAIAGIVGNYADRNLSRLDFFFKWSIDFWAFLIILALCLLPTLGMLIHYYSAHKLASRLNEMDDRLIRLLPSLYLGERSFQEREDSIRRVVKDLQQEVLRIFNSFQQCGIAIYLPSNENYLVTWTHHSTPNEIDSTLSFYIGIDSSRNAPTGARGIAGETFLDGKTRVVHINEKGIPDNPSYIRSPSGRIGYRALICASITDGASGRRSVGVLCFYSPHTNAFDSTSVQKLVEGLARRFSSVLKALENPV